jgi:hypothetical protein
MDWTQFATFLFINTAFTLTLWLWNRAESRSDHRELEQWTKTMLTAIQKEIYDFHGRLCAIEERNKK